MVLLTGGFINRVFKKSLCLILQDPPVVCTIITSILLLLPLNTVTLIMASAASAQD